MFGTKKKSFTTWRVETQFHGHSYEKGLAVLTDLNVNMTKNTIRLMKIHAFGCIKRKIALS